MCNKVTIRESQTVGQFIDTLRQFPQDLPIRIAHMPGADIWIEDEFYDGDPANPNCKIIEAVIVT